MNVSVIIPALNSITTLRELIASLFLQTLSPFEILILDSESSDGTAQAARTAGCRVYSISQRAFDHGGSRQWLAEQAHGDILVYLTQDVVLENRHTLDEIVLPFSDPAVGAVCGRQVPKRDANPLAAHARLFNYPPESCIKTKADIPRLGIKVPFVSNSFTAYRRSALFDVGGFPTPVVLSEDMHVAAKMILAGYSVAYAGQAEVRHSHNYTLWQEFQRYFDIGSFHAAYPWIQEEFGNAGGEGWRYLRSELAYARKHGLYWVARSFVSCFFKFFGFSLGKRHSFLPREWKRYLGMNKNYWTIR